LRRVLATALLACAAAAGARSAARAADEPVVVYGDPVPADVDQVYRRGLAFLVATQTAQGNWPGSYGQQPAVVGFATLALLAAGEDPNHGRHAATIRRAVRFLLSKQDRASGMVGDTMYNHGFATLALAEAYGHLDEPGVGAALRRAVDCTLAAQKRNPFGGWRYTPTSTDADITVTGCQFVSLVAARNAGIDVPQEAFDRAVGAVLQMQEPSGTFGYMAPGFGGGTSCAMAIGTLALALGGKRGTPPYDAAVQRCRGGGLNDLQGGGHEEYLAYYAAQALFQTDMAAWREWSREKATRFRGAQRPDGSWGAQMMGDVTYGTAMRLLALALYYRYLPIYER
jgi:hypothetical protein